MGQKQIKKPENTIPGVVNQEEESIEDILDFGTGEGDATEEGTSIDTGEQKEDKPLAEGKISKEKLIEEIKKNPDLAKEILGIGKEIKAKAKPKNGGDKMDALVDIVTELAKTIASGNSKAETPAGRPVSNELQNILGQAERQAMANLSKYKKQFKEEQRKGQTGELLIYPAYAKRLPTSSIKTQNADGTFNVKTTKFEIGFRGVLLSFDIGKKYKGVPNSIIDFINRKVAAYQDVVKRSGTASDKLATAGFDISKNAA